MIDKVRVLESGASSTTYLFLGREVKIVDPGCHSKEILEDFLQELGLGFDDVLYIYITHSHADHFASARYFKNAKIFASKISKDNFAREDSIITASRWFDNVYFPQDIEVLEEGSIFELAGEEFEVINLPGHSSSSIGFYSKSAKMLISGDTLFVGSPGRYDLIDSSKESLIDSLKKLKNLEYIYLLPGHGNIYKSSKEEQKKNIELVLEHFF